MTKKMKKMMFISLVVLLAISVVGCAKNDQEAPVGEVIAEYQGGQVTDIEFTKYTNIITFFDPQFAQALEEAETKKSVLEQYIGEKYIFEKSNGNSDSKDQAKNTFTQVKASMISSGITEKQFMDSLSGLNISEEDIISFIERYFGIQSYFVEKKYQENQQEFTVATVRHILIGIDENRTEEEAKIRAEEVRDKINTGEDFAQLAKDYSDDPGSADAGGKYEDVPVLFWVPEFKEAVLTLEINEISGLVRTDFGYHIIRVEERFVPEVDDIDLQASEMIYNQEYSDFITNELPSIITDIKI